MIFFIVIFLSIVAKNETIESESLNFPFIFPSTIDRWDRRTTLVVNKYGGSPNEDE